MTEEQLEQALETIAEDANNTTIIDNNGNNHSNMKTKQTEIENKERQTRISTRIKSTNPLLRLGNPVTMFTGNTIQKINRDLSQSWG